MPCKAASSPAYSGSRPPAAGSPRRTRARCTGPTERFEPTVCAEEPPRVRERVLTPPVGKKTPQGVGEGKFYSEDGGFPPPPVPVREPPGGKPRKAASLH